jgi:hypothetical protein
MSKWNVSVLVLGTVALFGIGFVATAAEKSDEGCLGLFLEPVPQLLAVHINLADSVGVVAADVAAEGPAEKAGISQYDVIISLNGKDVKGVAEFSAAIRAAGAGTKVRLGLINKGQKKEVEVVLGSLTDAMGKGKVQSSKSGRRLLKEAERQEDLLGPNMRVAPGFEPIPGGPQGVAPFAGPGVDDDRLAALEERLARIEKQQSDIISKLDTIREK